MTYTENSWLTKEQMLKCFLKICPETNYSVFYELLSTYEDYVDQDYNEFGLDVSTAVLDYQYGKKKYELWLCGDDPEMLQLEFLNKLYVAFDGHFVNNREVYESKKPQLLNAISELKHWLF